jgi:hypothetical protein
MMKEIVAYHGPFLKMGENDWYAAFDKEKPALLQQGIKTDLGQILLTGRDTDILTVAYDETGKAVGMAWGRLIKTFTHIDRTFVFPATRGQKIAEKMIAYLLKTRRNVLWNAVHEAMDHIAVKLGGKEEMVEGYRGWALRLDKAPKNMVDGILAGVSISQYCDKCKKKVPAGDRCSSCGQKIESKVPIKKSLF